MGSWRRLPKRLGGGYCRLRIPLKPAFGVRETVARRRPGALEAQGVPPPPCQCIPGQGQAVGVEATGSHGGQAVQRQERRGSGRRSPQCLASGGAPGRTASARERGTASGEDA